MINASHVKDLREKTGAGMMDCKRALVQTEGDFDAAIDLLRAKGLASAANKAGRIAAEGLVSALVKSNVGVVIEVNSETDFVALNDTFQNMVKAIANVAINCQDTEELKLAKLASGRTVQNEIMENVATIGENLSLRRMSTIRVNEGVVASYIHNSKAEGVGKIAVIVGLESKGDTTKLTELGKQIAMHIAATRPQSLSQKDIDPALVAKEREIFVEQSRASGKPDNIIEKMVDGRIRKFFEEVVLLDQTFVIDGKSKISELLDNVGKELNNSVSITKFIRYEVGEGIVQEKKNFADEVAAVIK